MDSKKILNRLKNAQDSIIDPYKGREYELFPHTFAQVYSQTSVMGERWEPYWYLKIISKKLVEKIAEEGHTGLLVSLPPRHGKSRFLSVWTPIWFLNRFPGKKVAVSTYSDDFSAKWGGMIRDEIQDNPRLNNIYLKKGQRKKSEFIVKYENTQKRSEFLGVGVGGGFPGKGYHLGIIDDAIKNWEEATSVREREKLRFWYDSVYSTRAEPDATSIFLMTRYHEDDLFSYVKEKHPEYEVLRFPAIMDNPDKEIYQNPLDTRDVGEPLNPKRKSLEELKKIKNSSHVKVWNAIWQQRPVQTTKASAFLWNADTIEECHLPTPRKMVKVAEELKRIVIAVDPSGSRSGDEVGIVPVGIKEEGGDDIAYVLGDFSGHYSPEGWAKLVQQLYDKIKADLVVGEKNYGGDMVESTIRGTRNVDNSINVELVSASRGKTVRAEPIVSLYERGLVKHIQQFDTLEQQMLQYDPNSSHNSPDRMDALVWGVTKLMITDNNYSAGFF